MVSDPVTRSVVVVRHGERLDYVMRDAGGNWVATSKQPWNPPLTDNGKEQAKTLGVTLPGILKELNLPPIAAIYSSPFLRCRQTAAGLAVSNDDLKVRVELGLAESINENFFRSWAVAGTDGTWGYLKKEQPKLDSGMLHPASKAPVQAILNWKDSETDAETLERMDHDFISTTSIETPFSLHPPNFESFKMQRTRMANTMKSLAKSHENETIVLVSHGGPVTFLYESLTGNKWKVHGTSKYCCYSIYQQKVDTDEWTPVVVNQVLGSESSSSTEGKAEESKTFAWA